MTTLISPLDETERPAASPPARLDSLRGKKIALLDISKRGGDTFLDRVAAMLAERYGAREIERFVKPTFARPAPDELIDRILRAQCQGVIEALAD